MLLKSGFFQLKKITKCPSFLWLEDLHKVLYAWIYSLLDYCHISYLRISLPPASPNCADYRYFNPEKLQISDLKTDDEFCKHSTWRVWTCNSVCTGLRRSRPSRFSSSPWCRDTLLSLTCSKTKQKKGLRTKYTKSYLFFVAQIQITVLTPTDQNLLKFAVDIQTHFHLCLSYSNFTSIFFLSQDHRRIWKTCCGYSRPPENKSWGWQTAQITWIFLLFISTRFVLCLV